MKIAILYIGIGGYKVFWKDFYSSCERYFLPNIVKEYFFFTDPLDELKPANVKEYFQEDLGWPGNTLYRFKMFLKYKEELAVFDFIYFFNGNTLFLDTINEEEIIPNGSDGYLVALSWYIYDSIPKQKYPYERDCKSTAYISKEEGIHYYQGGLNGGRSKEFLELMEQCNFQIIEDDKKGVVASHHDESHLNKYLLNKNVKLLSIKYGCPEEWKDSNFSKIIFRSKHKYFGTEMDKMKENDMYNFIYLKIKRGIKAICMRFMIK